MAPMAAVMWIAMRGVSCMAGSPGLLSFDGVTVAGKAVRGERDETKPEKASAKCALAARLSMAPGVARASTCGERSCHPTVSVRPRLEAIKAPATVPTACAATKPSALAGAMPAKLSLNMRPSTAAGLANEVLAVNQ